MTTEKRQQESQEESESKKLKLQEIENVQETAQETEMTSETETCTKETPETAKEDDAHDEPKESEKILQESSNNTVAQNENVGHKLRVSGFSKNINRKELHKLFEKCNIQYKNIKMAPKWDYCFLNFESASQLEVAKETISNMEEYKGRKISCDIPNIRPRDNRAPRIMQDDGRTPQERISDQTTPLWRMSYEEQLDSKNKEMKKLLVKLKNELWKFFPKNKASSAIPELDHENNTVKQMIKELNSEQRAVIQLAWLRDASKDNSGTPCSFNDILPSPVTEGYRSKCEFTFGRDLNGEKTCGFLLGLYKEGVHAVLNPKDCLHVSPTAKTIAQVLEDYVSSSKYDVYDKIKKQGFFRLALVRTLMSGQNMILVQVNPTGMSVEEIEQEKISIKAFLLEKLNDIISVDSLYFQLSDADFNGIKEDTPSELLFGTENITETILNQQFQISPTSFFQVNPTATEVLYSEIRDITLAAAKEASSTPSKAPVEKDGNTVDQAEEKTVVQAEEKPVGQAEEKPVDQAEEKPVDQAEEKIVDQAEEKAEEGGVVLLDLCCGTGTIGISMAQHVKKVVGVELVAEAIEDAKKNAAANGITNIEYMNNKVEEVMDSIFKNHVGPNDTVVAVLDPPRAGMHPSVIKSLRGCSKIDHIIFVACAFKSSMQNVVDFCRPTSNKHAGLPFMPVQCKTVDLFPHTAMFEVIIELKRQKSDDILAKILELSEE